MTTGQIGGRSTTVPAYRDIVHDWLRIALDNPADHLGSAALLTQYQNLAWDVHDAIPIKEDASLYDYDMPCVAVIRGGAFPDPTLGDLKGDRISVPQLRPTQLLGDPDCGDAPDGSQRRPAHEAP